jgi:hypothetical protein
MTRLGTCQTATLGAALGLLLAAAPPAAASELDLERLMGEMARSRGVLASFREVKEVSLLSEPIETRGTLAFAPPDRFVRRTSAPGATALYVDGDRLVFRDEAGGETVDLGADPVARRFVENVVVLWSGDLAALRERYEVRFEVQGDAWSLHLFPRRAPLRDFVREIAMAGHGARMDTMVLHETDGDRTVTHFEELVTDHAFSPEELEATFRPPQP